MFFYFFDIKILFPEDKNISSLLKGDFLNIQL